MSQLVEHEAGYYQSPLDEAGLRKVRDAPIDDGAGIDEDACAFRSDGFAGLSLYAGKHMAHVSLSLYAQEQSHGPQAEAQHQRDPPTVPAFQ